MNRHGNRNRGVTVVIACFAVTLLGVITCNSSRPSIPDLIPSDSCAVVLIDWPTVRNDVDLKRLFKGNQIENILNQLTLDSSSVKKVAIFTGINARAKSGVLLSASFDKERQISNLKMKGWLEQTLANHKVYVRGNDYVAVLPGATLFAGTREAAVSVFRTRADPREGFGNSQSYKQLAAGMTTGNAPVAAFLIIPQGTLDMADAALEATSLALSLFDFGAIGSLLKQLNIASGFGMTLGHGMNDTYPVEMCVLMRDEKAAALISGSLNLLKTFSGSAPTSARDAQALRDLSITRHGDVLSLKLKILQTALWPSGQ